MKKGEFLQPVRVYIEDTDAGGIVYYVNYLKFMERARTELMRSLGFDKDVIFNAELMFVVNDVAVEYYAPARLDDQLEVGAHITSLGAANMVLTQNVMREGELLVQGKVKIVCVDRHSVKPKRMPKAMQQALRSTLTNE